MTLATGRRPLSTFKWPLVLAGVTIVGLILGLLGTGWVDWLSVVLLFIPMAICGRAMWSGGKPTDATSSDLKRSNRKSARP